MFKRIYSTKFTLRNFKERGRIRVSTGITENSNESQ